MPRYWFQQKRFGYGATPNTWQGWALTIVSSLAVFGVILSAPAIRDNLLRVAWVVLGLSVNVIVAVTISYRKTEGGWRWRPAASSEAAGHQNSGNDK
jgi:hypothetical protein